MLRFPGFSTVDRLRFGFSSAVLKAVRDGSRFNSVSALDWMRRWAGPRVTELIWHPLLTGDASAMHAAGISVAGAMPRALARKSAEVLRQFERVAWGSLPIVAVAGVEKTPMTSSFSTFSANSLKYPM